MTEVEVASPGSWGARSGSRSGTLLAPLWMGRDPWQLSGMWAHTGRGWALSLARSLLTQAVVNHTPTVLTPVYGRKNKATYNVIIFDIFVACTWNLKNIALGTWLLIFPWWWCAVHITHHAEASLVVSVLKRAELTCGGETTPPWCLLFIIL